MMADDMVETPEFKELVLTFVDDEKARLKMSEAALGFETGNAVSRLADVVLNAAR